ncbi:hypothetical protein [uncultured Thomasclavelia sp.]|uniref:hypothetical protein n=1 Tax=uncultured Thomasclavelia sp. TaxID=3025759 RepID=UPI0025F7E481|nr:hypothetical protein [uncultured Thomasclavelia sp.]
MLKLLKYEIIESYRQYLLTFAIFLILCAITPIMPIFIGNILSILVVVAVIGISIAIFLNIIISFNRSMYKRPGYLTLTLPVTTNQLIGAKLIGSLVWVIVSSLVLVLGIVLLIMMIGEIPLTSLFDGLYETVRIVLGNFSGFIRDLVDALLATIAMILSFYFVITLTKTKYIPKYKTLFGIVIYVIGLILFGNILAQLSIDIYDTISSILVSMVLSVLFYLGTVYLIDHHIEVE